MAMLNNQMVYRWSHWESPSSSEGWTARSSAWTSRNATPLEPSPRTKERRTTGGWDGWTSGEAMEVAGSFHENPMKYYEITEDPYEIHSNPTCLLGEWMDGSAGFQHISVSNAWILRGGTRFNHFLPFQTQKRMFLGAAQPSMSWDFFQTYSPQRFQGEWAKVVLVMATVSWFSLRFQWNCYRIYDTSNQLVI